MSPKKGHRKTQDRGPLGEYLWNLRQACQLSLRQVEEESEVSNGYLSEIESGKIKSPMPHILFALCETYQRFLPPKAPMGCSYEKMMELAGHIRRSEDSSSGKRRGKLPTFAGEDLSDEEEEELLKYLAFLRMRNKK